MRIALGIPLPFTVLNKYCNAFSKKVYDSYFTHIVSDSREARCGDLFFSLSKDISAAEHISEAKSKGAKTVSSIPCDADFLVDDCETALLKLASFYKTCLKSLSTTIAITGSVGKTTTKEFCYSFFEKLFKTHKTYKNYNNALGVAFSLLTAPHDTEILILELGMNALGEIKALSDAVKPDYAVITNIANAHIGKLGSLELIAKAKLEISSGMKDEKIIAPYEEALLSSAKFKFSLSNRGAEYYFDTANNKCTLYHNSKKIIDFSTKYKAKHHLNAQLISLILGHLLKISEEKMQLGIKNCENISLRQKIINLKSFSLFDDTYSSSPEAVQADIEYLKLEYPHRPFSLALGDMLELGYKTSELHEEIGKLAYLAGARKLYAFGAYAYLICNGAKSAGMSNEEISVYTDTNYYDILAKEIYKKSKPGEIVLIKASHALHSEKITEEIERLDKEC